MAARSGYGRHRKTRAITQKRSVELSTTAPTHAPRRTTIPEYSFTLAIDGDVDEKLDELFEAGCDDATFGSVDGAHYADFDRKAPTLAIAIFFAISDVESVPGLRVRRVEPDDLVTAAEIAERLGRSRESVRLLIAGERGPGNFPAPVSHLRSRNRLWRWSDVAAWAGEMNTQDRAEARLIAAANASLDLRAATPGLTESDRNLMASWSGTRNP